MTVYASIEYFYYDGMLTFSQVLIRRDPASPVRSCNVKWLNSTAADREEE